MTLHVVHVAVKFLTQPLPKTLFRLMQIDIAEADLLKAEFAAPLLDTAGQDGRLQVMIFGYIIHTPAQYNRPYAKRLRQ